MTILFVACGECVLFLLTAIKILVSNIEWSILTDILESLALLTWWIICLAVDILILSNTPADRSVKNPAHFVYSRDCFNQNKKYLEDFTDILVFNRHNYMIPFSTHIKIDVHNLNSKALVYMLF